MKTGDKVQIYGQPMKKELPIGEAKLIEKIGETDKLEEWLIEYTDQPKQKHIQFIKKESNGENQRTTS